MTDDQKTIQALVREDLMAHTYKVFETTTGEGELKHNWHLDALTHHLTQCYLGNIRRLIITLPPRSLKSVCASVAFPTWFLGHDPTKKIICASYSEDLASGFARARRKVVEADWYKASFPKTRISKEKNTQHEMSTTRGGECIAASVGGTLTGKGGSLIIVDDPIKVDEIMSEAERNSVNSWYRHTLYTRLNNKASGCIIIVMQRVHMDDLVGHVLELDDWTVLNLPAIAPEDQDIQVGEGEFYHRKEGEVLHPEFSNFEQFMKDKILLGESQFSAQYLQSPMPLGGNIFKSVWFNRYPCRIDRFTFSSTVQSWDTASQTENGSNYSVCTTWGIIEARAYLLHVFRDRLNYPDLKAKVIRHARVWGADRVLIEKASSGIALLQDLCGTIEHNFIPIIPRLDKQARAEQVSAIIEAGRVYLPEHTDWLGEFENEILSFPESKYSDQVDSMTQFLLDWNLGGPRVLHIRVTPDPLKSTYYDRMGGSFPD